MENIIEVRLGGEAVDYLSLSVRGRLYRHSQDYWDGNWLLVTAVIHAGKFSGEIAGMLRAEELAHFSTQLGQLYQSLDGVVSFTTMEGWLSLQLQADKPGSVLLSGTVSDNVAYPYNELRFALRIDQSFLAATLKQLEQVVERYPVIGRP